MVFHVLLPLNRFPTAAFSRLCIAASRASETFFSTIQVAGLFRLAVPPPSFPTWELSVTEYNCQSVCLSLSLSLYIYITHYITKASR